MFGKLATVLLYKNTLYDLTSDIKSFWRADDDATDAILRESIQNIFSKTNTIFRIVIGIFSLLVVATVLKPFISKSKLMIPVGAYTFGSENDIFYLFVCGVQQMLTVSTTFYTPSMDMIYIGTCTSLMAQFKILRNFLETANQRQNFLEDVKKAVEHHNLLLG